MEPRRKILSFFLLVIYLLVVLHHSVTPSPDAELSKTPLSAPQHEHEDFKAVHHEHHFHVGIFHFLGHLLESIDHSNDLADEHLVVVQKQLSKKVVDSNKTTGFYAVENNVVFSRVDAESLPDPPPYSLFLFHRLKQVNTPLRAPPALV